MKKIITISGLVFLMFIFVGALIYIYSLSERPKSNISFKSSELEQYLQSGQYSKGAEYLKNLIRQDNSKPELYISLSDIYVLKNDYVSSKEILEEALTNTQSDLVRLKLSKSLFELKDYENSKKLILEIKGEEVKKDLEYAYLYTQVFLKLASIEELKIFLKDYLDNYNSDDAYLNLIASLLNSSTPDTALEYVNKTLNFDNANFFENLKLKTEEAKKLFEEYKADSKLEKKENNDTNLARLMVMSGLNDSGINLLNEIIQKNPEFETLYVIRGMGYLNKGDNVNAKKDLDKAYNINSTKNETLVLLGRINELEKDVKRSVEMYDLAVKLSPQSEENRVEYAKMLVRASLYNQAAIQYENLIKMNTANKWDYVYELIKINSDYLNKYAENKELINDIKNKWDGYNEADSKLRSDVEAIELWGLINLTEEDKRVEFEETQVELLEKINAETSVNPRTYYYLGKIYSDQKKVKEAIKNYESAIESDLDGYFTAKSKQDIESIK